MSGVDRGKPPFDAEKLQVVALTTGEREALAKGEDVVVSMVVKQRCAVCLAALISGRPPSPDEPCPICGPTRVSSPVPPSPEASPEARDEIPFHQHIGRVYDGKREMFFDSLMELLEHCITRGRAVPVDKIFTTEQRQPSTPDARGLVQRELEEQEFFEDAIDHVTERKIALLQSMLDAWWDDCGVTGYWSTTTRVALSRELLDYVESMRAVHAHDPVAFAAQGLSKGIARFYAASARTEKKA